MVDWVMSLRRASLLLVLFLTITFHSGFAGTRLDSGAAASGLKEALSQGTGRAVSILGRPDGYLGNPEVRIPMPDKLRRMEKALRAAGLGATVDDFVTGMNRAAEEAAPAAKPVFLDAVRGITFEDAVRIVRGNGHEATDYLQTSTRPQLTVLFRPIAAQKLNSTGATRSFNRMMKQYGSIPLSRKPTFDLEEYVTGKALDGLFLMIGREEEKIRKDPVSRTTSLLKKVFGAS